MIRTLFFLLILANLVFFAWTEGYFGTVTDGREPQRLGNQLAPEKLRVVGIGSPVSELSQSDQNCRLVTGLALSESSRLLAQAKEKYPELRLVPRLNDAPKSMYLVLIPPLGSKLAADRKAVELKKRGVADFTLIRDEGPDQFAILMGVFNTEQAANEHLRELAKRDVRSAKLQIRENPLDKAQLEVRGPADTLAKQLAELLHGLAAAKTGDCPAGR